MRRPHRVELQPVIAIDRKARARWRDSSPGATRHRRATSGRDTFKPSSRLVLTEKGERWVVRLVWLGILMVVLSWASALSIAAYCVYIYSTTQGR